MSTLTHAQYNSPMPLYSRDNVQEVLDQVTGYPYPNRPHSAMSGSFDPNQSHVYRYLQTGGQLPSAHSARYDEQRGADPNPKYKGFVDPNVQSPSFKRLQYVTGVDSGAEDEISHEVQPPAQIRSDDIRSNATSRQSGVSQQQGQSQNQPIALGYAPISGGQQQQQYQQQQYDQQYQQSQQQYDQNTRTQWIDSAVGPPVAQRDPTADDMERDHPLDPTFAARIAEAERPKVPPPVVPSWTRYAERKHDRWQHQTGGSDQQQQARTVQYYRPPPSTQHSQPQYTLDSSRAEKDKWQAHYAPYRFESGNTAASGERPRSRSVEPNWVPGRKYGGNKEWMKPYIAPNLRFNYGDGFGPPGQPSYSPLSSGRTYNISTKQQDYSQYGSSTGGYGTTTGGAGTYGGQTGTGRGVSPYGGGAGTTQTGTTSYGSQTQNYSNLSTSNQQQSRTQDTYGSSSYAPQQQGGRTSSAYDYTSSITQSGQNYGGTGTGTSGTTHQQSTPSLTKDSQSQYRRTVYESSTRSGTDSSQQKQLTAAPWSGSQPQSFLETENEAKRQRQMMEQEVRKRAASAGRQTDTSTTTVSSSNRQRTSAAPQENRVVTYTTSTGNQQQQQKWQQAPGSETKTASSGSYLDPSGNTVTFTKEVYTSSDPGKEFSMLTEQEKKILEEPLQPGVVSRHITTKYYKKSTYTSSTTTSTSQTPPVTTTTRHAIQSGPTPRGSQF